MASLKETRDMKRVNRLLTFLLLALLSTTLAWGGNIATTSSTGGTLAYYSNEACTTGLNVDNVAAGTTVYVKATPDAAHVLGTADADGKVTFITAQVTTSVFQSRRAGGSIPIGSFLDVWRVSDGIYRLTMPDDANLNVRVSAVFPNEELTTYLDVNGQEQEVMARILAGTETEIGTDGTTTWYVAKSTTAAFTHWLWLHGDVNIILADGATMTIGTAESPISNNNALYNSDGSTGIYAQSTGSSRGKLSVAAVNHAGIYSLNNITIVGAEVEATTSGSSYGHSGIRTIQGAVSLINAVVTAKGYYGICAIGSVAINGSQVTATGDNQAGIYSAESLTISGGQVTARGPEYGIWASTNITLGWTALTDFIHASSYDGTVATASGKRFVAYDDTETATAIVSGTVSDLNAIAGKTLRPMEGYLVTVPDGVAVAATRQVEGASVSVEPTIIGTTPYYIYKEGDQVTLTVTVPDGEVLSGISYSDGTTTTPLTATNNVCSFAMPAKDITVSFSTGPAPIPYLDENGEEQHCNSYTLLTGTITNTGFADGWYVAEGNVTFNNTIQVNGDAHLILKDGAVVNVGTEESPISYYGIDASGHPLSIYGQSKGENKGQLNVYSGFTGIYVYDASVTINGGQVKATGTLYGINASIGGAVTINGGEVTATGTNNSGIYSSATTSIVAINGGHVTASGNKGIYANYGTVNIGGGEMTANGSAYGIYANKGGTVNISGGEVTTHGNNEAIWVNSSSSLTISGGQVTANGNRGGIYADNSSVTLGWTNLTDFIHASRYSISGTGSISIAEGKTFIDDDGNTYESGPLSSEQLAALVDKTLHPLSEDAVAYLDMNGQRRYCQTYTVLTGSETTFGTAGQETWYVADGTLNYTSTINVVGDIHIILKDNAVMNVGTENNPIQDYNGIGSSGQYPSSINIYGQSTGANQGQLNVNVTGDYSQGIYAFGGDVNISSATVDVKSSNNEAIHAMATSDTTKGNINLKDATVHATGLDGLYAQGGNVTVNGGNVTAMGTSRGIFALKMQNGGSVIINGGQVTATGTDYGIRAPNGDIALSWTNATDYILANSYSASGTLSIAEGQAFISGSTPYSGTIAQVSGTYPIDDKKLLPAVAVTLGEGITAVSGIIASGGNGSTGSTQAYYAKVGATVTVNTNGAAIPAGYTITVTPEVSVTDNGNGTYSFTVPAEDVSVSSTTFASTGQAVTVSYIDADGNPQEHLAIALDGSETTLGSEGEETWYFVGADINYTDKITLANGGTVHLILADGKTMSVQSDMAIWGIAALTIYGQANGTGTLSSTGMIGASTITINGGNVSCITDFYAIIAMGDIVINGGTVYSEGVTGIICQNFGKSRAYRGMELSRVKRTPSEDEEASCNITINGGQVTAIGTRSDENGVHGGIVATGDITLGWRNASDYIYTNGYQAVGGTLSIAEGKTFIDEDGTTYSGTISPISIDDKNYIYAIDDKTLRPNIAVLKGDANKDGVVNVTDIMAVANYILNIGMTVFDEKAADVNGDNVVNVTDIMGIANIILNVTPSSNSRANSEVEDTPEPQ